jgi:DNA polymerase-3 subunit epsilon
MREIVLDTETTGMDPFEGDRLIEIGCVELENQIPTGKTYHQYINPARDVPPDAVAVHGITTEFLKDKPLFEAVYEDFISFIGDGVLIIHNAEFDMKFINYELNKVGHGSIDNNNVVDTLALARKKFPGSPASLDALCRRFGVDLSERELHGALLDAQLLAEVYLELLGGRQHDLMLSERRSKSSLEGTSADSPIPGESRPYREFKPSNEELEQHGKMLDLLFEPLWKKYS